MPKHKSTFGRIVRLLLFLLVLGLFSGCTRQPASSLGSDVSSGRAPAQSTSSIPHTSSPPFSYHSPETSSDAYPTPEQMSPTVPEGPLDAITDAGDLTGSWYHMAGPVVPGLENWVYQFRFRTESDNSIMLSYGKYQSGVGEYFRGEYTLGADGVLTSTLRLSSLDAEDPTPIHVTILAQKSSAAENLRIFTIQSITTESEVFSEVFSPLLGLAVAYIQVPA